MTSYTAIADTEIDAESPVTEELMTRMRDNPIAAFEGATGAGVLLTHWHPYDMVSYGDGNDGIIYDFDVDGALAAITSPDFVDGYEYYFDFYNLSDAGPLELTVDLYRETSASYIAGGTLYNDTGNYYGNYYIYKPRLSRQFLKYEIDGVDAIDLGSAQKVLRARFNIVSGVTNGGTITMYKRKVL